MWPPLLFVFRYLVLKADSFSSVILISHSYILICRNELSIRGQVTGQYCPCNCIEVSYFAKVPSNPNRKSISNLKAGNFCKF
ncbi:hypothetical protein AB3S75_035523 [Citrus x aurantiifolia]